MPSQMKQTWQKTISVCLITSCVLLEALLIFHIVYLILRWENIIGKSQYQDQTFNRTDKMFDDCKSKVKVVTDEAARQKWESCSAVFSQTWGNSEQNLRTPSHIYMESHQSLALELFTSMMQEPINKKTKPADGTLKSRKTPGSVSLYSSLSQAIQILKHDQMICVNTKYRAEMVLQQNISGKQIRFSTFILGSAEWNSPGNTSCFEIYSCFGAEFRQSACTEEKHKVLIPPYEVFIVSDVQEQTDTCKITYQLRSNMNCVYNKENNQLHSISVLPVEGLWLILIIICLIILSLLLPCIILKVNQKINATYKIVSLQINTEIL